MEFELFENTQKKKLFSSVQFVEFGRFMTVINISVKKNKCSSSQPIEIALNCVHCKQNSVEKARILIGHVNMFSKMTLHARSPGAETTKNLCRQKLMKAVNSRIKHAYCRLKNWHQNLIERRIYHSEQHETASNCSKELRQSAQTFSLYSWSITLSCKVESYSPVVIILFCSSVCGPFLFLQILFKSYHRIIRSRWSYSYIKRIPKQFLMMCWMRRPTITVVKDWIFFFRLM